MLTDDEEWGGKKWDCRGTFWLGSISKIVGKAT